MPRQLRTVRRVLHLRSSGGMFGAEAVIVELALQSRRLGWEPVVGVIHDVRDSRPALLDVAASHGLLTQTFPAHGRFDIGTLRALRRFAASEPIDLIHTHGYREDILGLLALRSHPRIATNHLWKLTSSRLRFYAAIDAWALRFYPRIIAVSREIEAAMLHRGLPASRIAVIPNGIDTERFRACATRAPRNEIRARLGVAAQDHCVLMVSSLTPEKGHLIALRGFHRAAMSCPSLRMIIVGDGPERASLEAFCHANDLARLVSFVGQQAAVGDFLRAADVYLMSSLQEGLPISLLEALSLGVPCIATAVGEIPAVLSEDSGLLIPVASPVAVTEALLKVVETPSLASRLGAAGAARVEDRFSAARMAAAYISEYDRLLA